AHADGRQQVAGDGQVEHLLLGNREDRGSPPLDRCELLVREPFIDGALEREGRKEVLAHERVLKLRGRAEHVDERAAMLDDDGALVHMLLTSQVEDVTQPTLDRLDARRRGPAWLWDAGAHLSAHLPRRMPGGQGLDPRVRG